MIKRLRAPFFVAPAGSPRCVPSRRCWAVSLPCAGAGGLLLPGRPASLAVRFITSRSARELLGLPVEPYIGFTVAELRQSYFQAAKRCHPDLNRRQPAAAGDGGTNTTSGMASSSSSDFIHLTQAYELLRSEATGNKDAMGSYPTALSPSEEEEYRLACENQLGLTAEIVEECKKNPGFLMWLSGRSDSAHHWRSFFALHGGLGPRLQPRDEMLSCGRPTGAGDDGKDNNDPRKGQTRGGGVSRRARLRRR